MNEGLWGWCEFKRLTVRVVASGSEAGTMLRSKDPSIRQQAKTGSRPLDDENNQPDPL